MKKLFLLPVIALVAIMAIVNVSADCCASKTSCYGTCTDPVKVADSFCIGHDCDPGKCWRNDIRSCTDWGAGCVGGDVTQYSYGCTAIPEFTSIGAGIALAGAGLGWALIRRKLKK